MPWPALCAQPAVTLAPFAALSRATGSAFRFPGNAAAQKLKLPAYEKAVGWGFGDCVFGAEFDVVSDMTKIRLAGFSETVDSAEALIAAIRRQQRDGTIPS
ncbi:MAG TPA: hypothetical protein VL356_01910 [Acidocella sp.]|nr:hypothetical protein [Acidocella sp.]